jgi:hypothetical protein
LLISTPIAIFSAGETFTSLVSYILIYSLYLTRFFHVVDDKSVVAEVVEECAGCTGDTDLILSPNAFKVLTGTTTGIARVGWFLVPL